MQVAVSRGSLLPRGGRLETSVALAAFVWIAAAPTYALDPSREVKDLRMSLWRQSEGLPQNTVRAILQARDGYLWLGTNRGVCRFDGLRFERFATELKESEVWALIEGEDHTLWVGTYGGGISRLEHGKVAATYTTADGLAGNFVRALHLGSDGVLWVGTETGLSRFRDGRFTNYTVKDGLPDDIVTTVYTTRDGTLWIGTHGGVARMSEGRLSRFEDLQFEHKGLDRVTAFAEAPDGTLWITAYNRGLFRVEGGRVAARFTKADGLADLGLHALWLDSHGSLWIGTDTGVSRYRDGRFSSYYPEIAALSANRAFETVSVDRVRVLCGDREGSLWLGTATIGLAQLRDSLFLNYRVENALPETQLSIVFEDRQGVLWAGTTSGLARFEKGAFRLQDQHAELRRTIISLGDDSENNLWIGTLDGLFTLRSGRLARLRPCGPTDPVVRFVRADRQGAMWIGAENAGLIRYRPDGTCSFFGPEALPAKLFRAIAEDHEGGLWIGLRDAGLVHFKDGRSTRYTTAEGLADDGVQVVHVDGDGDVWVGTRRALNRLRDGRWTTYTTAQGLPSSYVYSLLEDDFGGLWFTHSAGIFRVARKQLDDVADGILSRVAADSYDNEDGIRTILFTVSQQPPAWKGRDGRLWFASNSGVTAVDPGRIHTNKVVPPVHVESVEADGATYDADFAIDIPPGAGNLEIQYTALSYVTPQRVQFKYRLEGFDNQWIEAGTRRAAYYTNLSPGSYRFHVIGSNNDGLWNEVGAAVSLYLRPHFYQRGWFRLLSAGTLVALVWGLIAWRIRELRERERDLGRRVEERTRALKEEVAARQQAQAALLEERGALANRVADRTADLSRANAELGKAARLKDEFLASMSHELRTPLNAVLGMAEALQDEAYGTVNENQRSSLVTIEESGRHLLTLINDILDLSKVEAGRMDLAIETVSVSQVCERSLQFVREQAHRKRLSVTLAIAPGVDVVLADERRLKQILVNLLANAVKFTPDGGSIGLEVSGSAEDGAVRFTVWDTGIGLAPEQMALLFRPFVQIDSRLSRAYGGTGLGLALVKRMMELHGGGVSVESSPGQGSQFTVSLPWAAELAADVPVDRRGFEGSAVPAANAGSVLLIEDNEANIKTIGDYLRVRGFDVTVARNGIEGLEILKEQRPDVVLMDIQMPQMDGLEATRRIRSNFAWKDVPIIALTSLTMPGDRERCLEAGVDDYMHKPVRLKELVVKIREHLAVGRER